MRAFGVGIMTFAYDIGVCQSYPSQNGTNLLYRDPCDSKNQNIGTRTIVIYHPTMGLALLAGSPTKETNVLTGLGFRV